MKECDRYLPLMSRQIDGDLTQEEQDELFAHLSVCGHCSARFEVYSAMKLALSELAEEPPAEMAVSIALR
jgi:anti-sigma factor RsiW